MEQPCVLCRSKVDDEMIFGKVHKQDQLVVHYNCLYLSSNLMQNGRGDQGILNFLKKDIMMEVRRCRLLKCFYCHRLGANIGCCRSKCLRCFHTKCGFDNLAVNQFTDSYNSYCHQHVPKYHFRPGPEEQCMICFDSLLATGKQFSVATTIQSPCCQNGWYHRRCLQMYANSAGYFFKCPLCNDEEKFGEVKHFGISIPNCDASWELEPNAFADQLQRAQDCTSNQCRMRRTTTATVLLYCIMCGSNPMHTICTTETAATYRCADCIVVAPSVASGSADSDGEMDDFERFAELHRMRTSQLNATRGLNGRPDLQHSKLTVSMRISSESDDDDTDDDDDEDVFEKIRRIQNQSRLPISNPASGSSSSSAHAALSARRTLPFTIPEQNENGRAKKRRGSPGSPMGAPGSRRLLQPITPQATAVRSNEVVAESTRRRTMPYARPTYPSTPSNMDESCVANRTRTRLPSYMANKK